MYINRQLKANLFIFLGIALLVYALLPLLWTISCIFVALMLIMNGMRIKGSMASQFAYRSWNNQFFNR